ncbi:MAG: sugar phosphate nucleotidyltransferase [Mycobacterium sp.]
MALRAETGDINETMLWLGSSPCCGDMQTVILCGGTGVRAMPSTLEVPKPLLLVGDRPVLAHVMEIYADQGFTDFVLAAGYKAELVWKFAQSLPASWRVEVVDTGENTNTGGRVMKVRERLGEEFFLTYCDGLGDVDLHRLLDFHRAHGGAATVTTVSLPSPYGTFDVDEKGRVSGFREKPKLHDHLINAGFFVMDSRVFDRWDGEDLEREVLPSLADAGDLFAYRHEGFWKSMDTQKDAQELTALCERGRGPWVRLTGTGTDPYQWEDQR